MTALESLHTIPTLADLLPFSVSTHASFDAPHAAQLLPLPGFRFAASRVAACTCAGECRCGGLVPALLLREIETECEFYRSVL
jgi:hypothetical protein